MPIYVVNVRDKKKRGFMLRKSIIMMALAATFTMNVSAVQIEVPAGKPPVPGADGNIPVNAYENYSHINENTQKKLDAALIFYLWYMQWIQIIT